MYLACLSSFGQQPRGHELNLRDSFLSDFKVYFHRELEKNSPFQVPFSSRNNEAHKNFPKFNKCNQMCLYFLQPEWAGGAEDGAITP